MATTEDAVTTIKRIVKHTPHLNEEERRELEGRLGDYTLLLACSVTAEVLKHAIPELHEAISDTLTYEIDSAAAERDRRTDALINRIKKAKEGS